MKRKMFKKTWNNRKTKIQREWSYFKCSPKDWLFTQLTKIGIAEYNSKHNVAIQNYGLLPCYVTPTVIGTIETERAKAVVSAVSNYEVVTTETWYQLKMFKDKKFCYKKNEHTHFDCDARIEIKSLAVCFEFGEELKWYSQGTSPYVQVAHHKPRVLEMFDEDTILRRIPIEYATIDFNKGRFALRLRLNNNNIPKGIVSSHKEWLNEQLLDRCQRELKVHDENIQEQMTGKPDMYRPTVNGLTLNYNFKCRRCGSPLFVSRDCFIGRYNCPCCKDDFYAGTDIEHVAGGAIKELVEHTNTYLKYYIESFIKESG